MHSETSSPRGRHSVEDEFLRETESFLSPEEQQVRWKAVPSTSWPDRILNSLPFGKRQSLALALGLVLLVSFLIVVPASYPRHTELVYTTNSLASFNFASDDYSPALPHAIQKDLQLSHEQCGLAFPKFWPQLLSAKEAQLEKGKVKLEDLYKEGGGARVAIIDGNLFVKSFEPFGTRTESVLASLHDAIVASPSPLPDVDFFFRPIDIGEPGPVFETTIPDPGPVSFLIPDFGFQAWPEPIGTGYKGVVRNAERVNEEITFREKIPKLFWRGAFLAPIREALRDKAAGYEWGDIDSINWQEKGKGSVPLWEHCRYKYLAQTEGFLGAYSGRLKYLLNCRSVVISHKSNWHQHFHPAVDTDPSSPNRNMIMLPRNDWEELPNIMLDLEQDQAKAERIADNAWRTLKGRYLTPAATACYWRRLIVEYAEVQDFEPEIGDGTDYESFMLMGRVKWDPSR